jgi:hypothetical protein
MRGQSWSASSPSDQPCTHFKAFLKLAATLQSLQLAQLASRHLAAHQPPCTSACRAHGVSPTYPSLLAPGELSQGMLRGLDYWLAEAGKRGIKVRWQWRRCGTSVSVSTEQEPSTSSCQASLLPDPGKAQSWHSTPHLLHCR